MIFTSIKYCCFYHPSKRIGIQKNSIWVNIQSFYYYPIATGEVWYIYGWWFKPILDPLWPYHITVQIRKRIIFLDPPNDHLTNNVIYALHITMHTKHKISEHVILTILIFLCCQKWMRVLVLQRLSWQPGLSHFSTNNMYGKYTF